jgi:hypothetical protein
MKNNLTLIFIALLLAGIIIGYPIGKGCNKCPEIKVGTETTLVTITHYDTVITHKTKEQIKVIKVYEKVPDTTSNAVDSTVCYNFDETEKDGAYIAVNVCSDSLPATKPLDLKANISYQAPPDTGRTIFRTDTVSIDKTMPFYKDWKFYLATTLALVGGLFLGSR